MSSSPIPTRRVATVVVVALLGALLTALALSWTEPEQTFTAGRVEAAALPLDITAPAARQPARPPGRKSKAKHENAVPRTEASRTPRPVRLPPPRLLSIPRLDLRMPVVSRGVDASGAMALPGTSSAVGWYRFGAHPRGDAGAVVLAGHVDTAEEGPGPLAGVGALRDGDRIEVRTGRGSTSYRVTSVTRIAKSGLDLPVLFSRVGSPRLHLVTCGGAYLPDRGGYQDNVVVAARRVSR